MWVYKEIRTLGDYVSYHARKAGERPALIYAGHITSYRELDTQSTSLAQGLLAAGISAGDRVVYLGKNSDDFFVALFGTAKSGACFCPLNWRLSEPELCRVLADTDARLAFVEPELGLFGSAYVMARPGVGVTTSDIKIYQGLGRSRLDALYSDNQTQIPAPDEFLKFSLPTGLSCDLSAGPERYQLSYEGIDDTRFELQATAVMPAYDIHDPAMDPMARKTYDERAATSGYGAAYGGHYDQLCRIKGKLTVRGKHFDIDYIDCMDRSWGVRPERALQPMAWLHAIFGEDYAFHSIWSMNYDASPDAQHSFAHGFVLDHGKVYGCTAGKVIVARDGMWGAHYELFATDERGTQHHFLGAPIASGLWEPYGCVGVPNVLNRFVSDSGRIGYGEVQEGWFYDTYLRLRAAGKL